MPESISENQPLVSVITVTYNSSAYVADAIESVLGQDYSNIEYIIGDDCSTDNTWEIISSYHDSRIKPYRNESNLREYANRNKALGMATGKYLIFIDGDDIILSHGVGYFLRQMEKYPGAALAIQKGYINNIVFPIMLEPEETLSNLFFGGKNLLISSFASNFFRTDILKKAGGLSTNYVSGDDEIRLRLATQFPVLFVSGWVSWPRETPGQASSKISARKRLIETFNYTRNLVNTKTTTINRRLVEDINGKLKKECIRFFVRSLFKGDIAASREIMAATGLSFKDIWRFINYQSKTNDPLLSSSPNLPLKMKTKPMPN